MGRRTTVTVTGMSAFGQNDPYQYQSYGQSSYGPTARYEEYNPWLDRDRIVMIGALAAAVIIGLLAAFWIVSSMLGGNGSDIDPTPVLPQTEDTESGVTEESTATSVTSTSTSLVSSTTAPLLVAPTTQSTTTTAPTTAPPTTVAPTTEAPTTAAPTTAAPTTAAPTTAAPTTATPTTPAPTTAAPTTAAPTTAAPTTAPPTTPAPTTTAAPSTTAAPANTGVRQQVLDLTNQARAANGCQPLVFHDALNRAADAHSADMSNRNFFDHTNPDGQTPSDRAEPPGTRVAPVRTSPPATAVPKQ